MFPRNASAENTLSTIGAVLWTVQILPQLVKSYRSKSTKGLSTGLMALWTVSAPPFAAYVVAQKLSIALQVQPHAFGFLCTVSWAQCLYYGHGYSRNKVISLFALFVVLWVGFEVGSVYALRIGVERGTKVPIYLYGYLNSVFIVAGMIPQFWEIYKLKQVIGISLLFMAVDILGGIFSLLSLFFRDHLDVAALVSYLLVVVLDGLVILLAFVLNPMARRRKERENSLTPSHIASSEMTLSYMPMPSEASTPSVDEKKLEEGILAKPEEHPEHETAADTDRRLAFELRER